MYQEPGYWDGRLQLVTEWDGAHPRQTTISSSPTKIKLHSIDLHDQFVDSLMNDNCEYKITTEKDTFNSDWTRWAHWKLDKIQWVIKFIKDYSSFKDEAKDQKTFEVCEQIKQQILAEGRVKFKEYVNRSLKNKHMPAICAQQLDVLAEFVWSKGDFILEPQAHGTDYICTRVAGKYFPYFKVTYDGKCTVVTENWLPDLDRPGFRKKQPDTEIDYLLFDWETYTQEYNSKLGND